MIQNRHAERTAVRTDRTIRAPIAKRRRVRRSFVGVAPTDPLTTVIRNRYLQRARQ